MLTYDFRDGKGLVSARQHPNGGGWVADTSHVADTVYVGPHARVYHTTLVVGNIIIADYAQVYGNVKLSGNVVVSGYARIYGHSNISGNFHISGCIEFCESLHTPARFITTAQQSHLIVHFNEKGWYVYNTRQNTQTSLKHISEYYNDAIGQHDSITTIGDVLSTYDTKQQIRYESLLEKIHKCDIDI